MTYTPTTEAIEAAARALWAEYAGAGAGAIADTWDEYVRLGGRADYWHDRATTALTVAGPLMEANALREAADALAPTGTLWWGDSGVTVREGPFGPPTVTLDNWLRARAATIEGGSE